MFKNDFAYRYDVENKTLNGVPMWRLFIDKSCQNRGEMVFDTSSKEGAPNEPGYNRAMQLAFHHMLTTLNTKLNAQEFENFHHLCIEGINFHDSERGERIKKRGFTPGGYCIHYYKVTEEAKREWESEGLIIANSRHSINNHAYLAEYTTYPLMAMGLTEETEAGDVSSTYTEDEQVLIANKIDELCAQYYSQIDSAESSEDKIAAIVTLCRQLEIAHFFSDGNQRTIVFVILNKLLIENGFYPVILDDPYVFDGYHSKQELMNDILQGQKNFLTFMQSTNVNKSKFSLFTNALLVPSAVGEKKQTSITSTAEQSQNCCQIM